ncbi:MAG: hypothetical protein CVV44_08325 [Spirochaetae bacterium HGW-Spirochaetae-1]|jgi:hypothetical protein|nr:MAG: hypothetical protein CVV44_08325 [Spirochaetae bacterium HGW-Spirochaetae-1]
MSLHSQKKYLLVVNIVGGIAVLFSYIQGLQAHPEAGPLLWGEVPAAIMPLYTISMFSAATGYLLFTWFILFRLNADEVKIAGRFSYVLFNALYILILAPSALWMPLTFIMLEQPSLVTWVAIRVVLAAVGIGSAGMLAALFSVRPRAPLWAYIPAVIGSIAFCVQTALLDALVWPAFFPLTF